MTHFDGGESGGHVGQGVGAFPVLGGYLTIKAAEEALRKMVS